MKNVQPDIELNKYKIVSFDIFDTLLTRRVAHPFGVFYLMQKKLLAEQKFDEDFINSFVHLRIEAEATAKIKYKKKQADFKEIYQVICDDQGMTEADRDTLMALEFAIELDSVQPIESMVKFLEKVRNSSLKIIFATDMYLNVDYIQQLLNHIGIYKKGEVIYSSSSANMTKASGALFKHILRQENCLKEEIIHIGNNYDIDIIPAQNNGFATYYYNHTDSTRYEIVLSCGENRPGITSFFFQRFAGASRIARLHNRHITTGEKVYADLGSNVAGPVLYAFVSWILIKARGKKLNRLYFIARDGQILFEIANKIKQYFYPDVDLRYIYGSRQAWHLPSITSIQKRELEWLLDQQPFLTLGAFARRVMLDTSTLHFIYQKYSGKNIPLDKPLTAGEIQLLEQIITSSELSDIILENAKKERKKTLAYFTQEGLLETNISYGIVDMGWAGRLQESLAKILATSDCNVAISGFYFGLTRKLKQKYGKTYCYFFSHDSEKLFTTVGLKLLSILEVLTTADHASTVSFSETNGEYKPVFKKLLYDEQTLSWIKALRGGMYGFLSNMDGVHKESVSNKYALKKRLVLLMETLYTSPTFEEAQYLGRFPYCTDQVESFSKDLAPIFTKTEAFKLLFVRANTSKGLTSHWIQGSRIRSGKAGQKILSPRFFQIRRLIFHFLRRVVRMLRGD